MSNEFVMLPRELAQFIADGGYCRQEKMEELRSILAAPVEEHHGEPVALPARKDPTEVWAVPGGVHTAEGWNACLDEIAKLGPLYTRADSGEVQHLRKHFDDVVEAKAFDYRLLKWENENLRADLKLRDREIEVAAEAHGEIQEERDILRARLTEAHALLREVRVGCYPRHLAKIGDFLSASAEPSDECAHSYANLQGCPECGEVFAGQSAPDFNKDAIACRRYELNGRVFFHYDATPIYDSTPITVDELVKMAMLSAPVEIDERAEFEAHMLRDFPGIYLTRALDRERYRNPSHQGAWLSWQARAALECKP